jgi:hypothetical protein
MKKTMTMKKWEGSAADKRKDKKLGLKEGSKRDMALDRKMVAKLNKKK